MNKCLLLRVPSVCEVLKGRQRDLAFFPVFEEFMAWIAVQDLETLTSKRSSLWETLETLAPSLALGDYPKVTVLRAAVTHLLLL